MPRSDLTSILIDQIKKKVFHMGVGERTKTFVRGASYSVSAAFVSRVISGITTVLVARWLGPKEFGEANLSLASVLWIQIPLFMGLPLALVHYHSKEERDKSAWIQEGTSLMTVFMLGTFAIGVLFRSFWANLLGISQTYFLLALFWCACSWPFSLLRTLLNTMERFVFRSWIEVLYSVLFPCAVVFWIHRGYQSGAYILGLSIPYAIVGLIGLFVLKPPFPNIFKLSARSKKMFFYGLLGGTGALATTLFDSPARLVANKVLSTYQVGIISAYQGGSTQMAVFLLTAGAQVFFPIASRTPDKKALFHKLNRALWPTFPLIILAFLLGLTLYLKILGDKYPTQLIPCFVFAIAAALGFVNGILIWFVITYGWRGITLNAVVGVGAGLIHLLTCFFAIPRWGLNGAGLAYIFANAIVTAGLYLPRVQEWLNKGETHALKV